MLERGAGPGLGAAMNAIDIAFAAAVALSTVFGIVRGFVREAVSLAGWVAAVVLALRYAHWLGDQLPIDPAWATVRLLAGGALIVIGCLLVAALAGRLLHAMLAAARLSGFDRALGALFGAVRGLLLMLLAAAVVVHGGFARQSFWTGSSSAPYLEAALRWITPYLPQHAVPRLVALGSVKSCAESSA